jgi:hypothetical protein
VIAGDEDHRHAAVDDESREHFVQELDRIRGRAQTIVDIAREEHGVEVRPTNEFDELFEDVGLVVQKRDAEEAAAEVPIGGVEETHDPAL